MVLFNNKLIKEFNTELFETLLYKHHLSTSTAKKVEFDDDNPEKVLDDSGEEVSFITGYTFIKDNIRYLLKQYDNSGNANLDKLPIRIMSTFEIITKNKDMVRVIEPDFKSFSISPAHILKASEIIQADEIVHDIPEQWNMQKIIAFTAYCRRINVLITGVRGTGKTSYFNALGMLTNKGFVIAEPGSVAGISKGITEDGYICFDEIGSLKAEERRILRKFLFQAGDFSPEFVTGKAESRAHNLLSKYDIRNLSCILLSNLYEDYLCIDNDTGEIDGYNKKKFIAYMFDNNQAINDRFLALRLNPSDFPVTREGRKDLNIALDSSQFVKENSILNKDVRSRFVSILKSLEWYRVNWLSLLDQEFINEELDKQIEMKGRQMLSYREILCGIYIVSGGDRTVFGLYRDLLNSYIDNHYAALGLWNDRVELEVKRK